MYLGPKTSSTKAGNKPFRYYHRVAGGGSIIGNIAVDIDFENNLWRVMKQNDTDLAHICKPYLLHNQTLNKPSHMPKDKDLHIYIGMSHDSKLPIPDSEPPKFPIEPTFRPIREDEMLSGAFSSVSPEQPHMFIPSLYLAIPNMYIFIHSCYIEPFMRVIDVSQLEHDKNEMKRVLESQWDGKSDDRVLMRTAAFGHGRGDLSICAREGAVITPLKGDMPAGDGMMNELLVSGIDPS